MTFDGTRSSNRGNTTTLGWLGVLGCAVLLAAGCGRQVPLGEVEGTVRMDGRPLGNVLVRFLPDPDNATTGPASAGAGDAEGRFRLRCDDQRDGAVVGWHRVVVEDLLPYAVPRDEKAPSPAAAVRSRVPPAYTASASTPLRFEVKPGRQAIDLDLTAAR